MSHVVEIQLNSQLADVCDQFRDNSLQILKLADDLHHHQLNLRIESDRWSIAEAIVHLTLFSEVFISEIRLACFNARQKEMYDGGPYKMDFVGRLLKYALEPPSKWTAITPHEFEPLVVEPLEKVIPTFNKLQSELIESVIASAGLDLNRIKITSPVSKHVRYNLYSCFQIIAAHQRRHVRQAAQSKSLLLLNQR